LDNSQVEANSNSAGGGGVSISRTNTALGTGAIITETRFISNTPTGQGSGVLIKNGCSALILSSVFITNELSAQNNSFANITSSSFFTNSTDQLAITCTSTTGIVESWNHFCGPDPYNNTNIICPNFPSQNRSASYDSCEVCAGNNTEVDCGGICWGHDISDEGGCCRESQRDCFGLCFGNVTVDCAGVCNGSHVVDRFGTCCSGYLDCDNVCNGSLSCNPAGECCLMSGSTCPAPISSSSSAGFTAFQRDPVIVETTPFNPLEFATLQELKGVVVILLGVVIVQVVVIIVLVARRSRHDHRD